MRINVSKIKTNKFEDLGNYFKKQRETLKISHYNMNDFCNTSYSYKLFKDFEDGYITIEPSNLFIGCIYIEMMCRNKIKFDYQGIWEQLSQENASTRELVRE